MAGGTTAIPRSGCTSCRLETTSPTWATTTSGGVDVPVIGLKLSGGVTDEIRPAGLDVPTIGLKPDGVDFVEDSDSGVGCTSSRLETHVGWAKRSSRF